MKILFDFQDMSGGAPRSQLTHMQLMHSAGHEVLATIDHAAAAELAAKAPGIHIIPIQRFNTKKPLHNMLMIRHWLALLKRESPDIIHANRISHFNFLAVVSDIANTPLVFAQAGGRASARHLIPMLGKTAVSYSPENNPVFEKSGFKRQEIHVLTNRIVISEKPLSRKKSDTEPLQILVAGNIKKDTITGISHFLDLLISDRFLPTIACNIRIAGADLSPDQQYTREIEAKLITINQKLEGIKNATIRYTGWADDIEQLQADADICIGKGRSVLQAAMRKVPSFVIAETGHLTQVSENTFDDCYRYNFSGRGNQANQTGTFLNALSGRSPIEPLITQANQVYGAVMAHYHIARAQEKLETIYRTALKQQIRTGSIRGIRRFITIYRSRLTHQ